MSRDRRRGDTVTTEAERPSYIRVFKTGKMLKNKTDYWNSIYAKCFSEMSSDGREKRMFDRWGSRRHKEMGAWNGRCTSMRSWCPGCISPTSLFDRAFVRHNR